MMQPCWWIAALGLRVAYPGKQPLKVDLCGAFLQLLDSSLYPTWSRFVRFVWQRQPFRRARSLLRALKLILGSCLLRVNNVCWTLQDPFFWCSIVGSSLNWKGMGGTDDAFIGSFYVLLYVFNRVQSHGGGGCCGSYTQKFLHKTFFYRQKLCTQQTFAHSNFSHREAFKQRSFYTEAFTHRSLCTKKLLHTANSCTQKLWHRIKVAGVHSPSMSFPSCCVNSRKQTW